MSENLPNIDDLFRKAVEAHEDTPSATVWAHLDKNLDKKKVVFISKKYKKLKWVAAALLIFSTAMAMYTWNTRLRNKELVRQNEINKKKSVKAGASANANNENNIGGKTVDDKANIRSTEKVAADKPIVDTNGTDGTTLVNKTSIIKTKNQSKGRLPVVPGEVVKNADEKKVRHVAVINRNQYKEKPISKPQDLSGKNELSDKEPNGVAVVVRKSKVGADMDKKNESVEKNEVVETVKRYIETGTVREHEKNVAIAEPANINRGKALELPGENSNEIAADKIQTAYRKSSIKPFRGSKFSATIFYSPDFVSVHVDNDRHTFREEERNEIKNKEKITHSSSKGVLINYNIGNRWNIQSGLIFSTMTTDIMPKTIFARPDNRGNINYRFNCSAGYSFVNVKSGNRPASGDSIFALSSKNTLRYFTVPFALSYNFPVGRFTLQPGAGLAANFLTKSRIETEIAAQAGNEKFSNQIEGLNSSYLNGSLSLSANYYFTKNIALNFTPVARFALSAINKNTPVKTYLNSFGLGAGLTIGF